MKGGPVRDNKQNTQSDILDDLLRLIGAWNNKAACPFLKDCGC